jgi:CRISPR/Cas system-associated protein Csm6
LAERQLYNFRDLTAVVVHPTNEHDSQAAPSVLKQLLGKMARLKVIFVGMKAFQAGSSGGVFTGFFRLWSRKAQALTRFQSD